MDMETLWFCLIAILWGGYFLLEGFDFGVGMLLPFVPRDERGRGVLFDCLGPVWDGNEVWLVVAAGAMFAAFPTWYATMFSAFYLALLAILVLLVVRAVSFEWRGRSDDPRWRAVWLWANVAGSVGVPFLWGLALANLVNGVPLSSGGDFAGSVTDLFSPYTVAAGATTVIVFAFHGANFLGLRTVGPLRERADRGARLLAVPALLAGAVLVVWTVVVAAERSDRAVFPPALPAALAVAGLALAAVAVVRRRSGWAFVMTSGAVVLAVATLFVSLYPHVMVSSPVPANSLTVSDAASAHYTLAVITVVAVLVTPIVLLYQAWTYHVFRERITGRDEPAAAERPGEPQAG
jgi:cytochrome bd ubiquinol oxidase subunit II